jgi:hypothetical protein
MEHKDYRIIWKAEMHGYLQRTSENCKDHIHDLGSSVAFLQDQLGAIPYPQRVAAEEEPHDRAHAKPAGKALPDAGLVSALQGLVVLLHCPFLTGERCDLQHKEQGQRVISAGTSIPWHGKAMCALRTNLPFVLSSPF